MKIKRRDTAIAEKTYHWVETFDGPMNDQVSAKLHPGPMDKCGECIDATVGEQQRNDVDD